MELVKPEIGLIFWMTVTFLIVFFLLRKFAWKPILNMIHEREATIEDSLKQAEKARDEMKNLRNENEQLLAQARSERDHILKEAKEIKEKLISDAKGQAQEEATRIVTSAKESIEKEKQIAMRELRQEVVNITMDIATKVLKTELSSEDKQKELIENYLNEVTVQQ